MTTAPAAARALGALLGAGALAASLAACGTQVASEPVSAEPTTATSTSSAPTPSASATTGATASATASTATGGASATASTAPSDASGSPVTITAPAEGEHLPAGPVGVVGTGTAPEGTLLWRITQADGTVLDDGYTTAGANGEVGEFSIQQTVQAGTCAPCTVAVWVPDESDGEGVPSAAATRTFFVD